MRRYAERTVLPHYPERSLARRNGGVAVAAIRIDVRGRVRRASILQSPDPEIAAAVTGAVVQWRFRPASAAGRGPGPVPVSVDSKLTFYFEITQDGTGHVKHPEAIPHPTPNVRGEEAVHNDIEEIDANDLAVVAVTHPIAILDIRNRGEFEMSHRKGAVNIPADEVSTRYHELGWSRTVVIDCYPGRLEICRMVGRQIIRALPTTHVKVLPSR